MRRLSSRATLAWLLIPLLASLCRAEALVTTVSTNGSTATTTNASSVATNMTPSVTQPRSVPTINGSTLMAAFGGIPSGKFSISGRTLKLPAPDPSSRVPSPAAWHRALDFGMNMTQGNSDTLRYSLGLDVLKERPIDLFRVSASGTYGESDGKTDTENALTAMRYERKLTEITYALGNVEWMTDPISDLDYRLASILSPGIHLIQTERTLLNVEVGAGYLMEKKGDEQGFFAGRFAVTFEKVINPHVLFWASGEYLPKLFDSNVFYINSEVGLATVLARNLSLTLSVQDRYDNAPVENNKSNDSVLTTALNLNF